MKTAIPQKKIELHVHLDGAVRPSTAWELAQKKGIIIPGIKNFIEFEKACVVTNPTNLWGFLKHFGVFWPSFCGDLDAFERIAYEYCEDASYAGIIYAEVRYSPALALGDEVLQQIGPQGLDEVIRRVSQGLKRGEADFGIQTRMILCARYSKDLNDLEETLRLCQSHFQDGVVGMDLLTLQPQSGIIDEAPVVEPIVSVYRDAARTGVHRTIHAAESSSSQAVDRAVYQLGSERVGHGYHVVEDNQLYERCVKDQVHFECCPYSSLMTGSVAAPGKDHPIARFARDGANFSISSDDPTVTGHFVQADYELLASWDVTGQQMRQANINAVNSCFLDEHGKKSLLKQLQGNEDPEGAAGGGVTRRGSQHALCQLA